MENNQAKTWTHWRLDVDEGVANLWLDRADASVNTLNEAILAELDAALTEVEAQKAKALVLRSAKKSGFVAGADITLFQGITSERQASDLMTSAHAVLHRLEALRMPTLALIDGFCLGGGFELALACRYRVAIDQPKTKIGLPEVKLGIIPGWGGTVRLPRLIGVQRAMAVILPGRALSARAAKKMGMVTDAVPLRDAERAVAYYLKKQPKPRSLSVMDRALTCSFMRPWAAKKMLGQLKAKHVQRAHYPAPYAVIENWVAHGAHGQAAYDAEIKSIASLMMTPTSRHLVDVFFMSERLKSDAKGSDFKAKHVHVVGAGTMGGDIAACCALRGMRVTLQDREARFIGPAIKRAHALFKKRLKRPHLIMQAMDRLIPDVAGHGVQQADVIIEAIIENTEAKQALFKSLEASAKPSAVLATNTSSIPLGEIAVALQNPGRLVGIHFFNPVPKMPLVEIVHAPETEADAVARAQAFVLQMAKMPLPVASRPGFLVNRVLMPYLMEAMLLMEEGVSKEAIDQAALDFGMPMGPVRLADQVGLDICLSVAENLASSLGLAVPDALKRMVDEGALGCKTQKGFYHYKKGKVQKTPKAAVVPQTSKDEGAAKALTSDTLTDRLMLSMLNESVACLRDGVVHDADALDIGMILGTGFAPFRAGPMHYAHDRGVDEIIATLESLASSVGSRFEPDAGWHEWVAPKHDASASLSDKPQDDAGQVHDASDACDEGTVPLK